MTGKMKSYCRISRRARIYVWFFSYVCVVLCRPIPRPGSPSIYVETWLRKLENARLWAAFGSSFSQKEKLWCKYSG